MSKIPSIWVMNVPLSKLNRVPQYSTSPVITYESARFGMLKAHGDSGSLWGVLLSNSSMVITFHLSSVKRVGATGNGWLRICVSPSYVLCAKRLNQWFVTRVGTIYS